MYKPSQMHLSNDSRSRTIIVLVALCCLSFGITIGVILHGIVSARSEDNRLSISASANNADALSATFARVAREVEPSVAHIKMYEGPGYTREGTGSGVIVNSAGYVLTNAHVVRRATRIRVKLSDGAETDARVIGIDVPTDLAVIKIDISRPLPAARMGDSDKLNVGDWVLAIGSPFGLEQTVTAGIISAKDRVTEGGGTTPFQQFLQTDAAINPGNSGGPLINLAGEVIGINTQIATNTGGYNGIGFALPSASAVEVYNQLVSDGRVRRGFLGIKPQEITPQIARLNKIADGQGIVVLELTGESSPAARGGLLSGDVITSINGMKVKTVRELIRRIASLPVGSVANIEFVRDGKRQTANIKLEERQEDGDDRSAPRRSPVDPVRPGDPGTVPDRQRQRQGKPESPLGISVRTLTPELAKMNGLDGARGAFVVSVDRGSIADENNLTEDDLIVEMNNRPVATQEDFSRVTRDLKSGDDVVLKVLRKERGPLRRLWIVSFTMP
ncbi:MAG TPA: trypsin-like peptidase domain-containing protein [Blastocatellia bacterium]|nr:trypsin-like peptidase domain-containing protein [Blastocatellia bacterium]